MRSTPRRNDHRLCEADGFSACAGQHSRVISVRNLALGEPAATDPEEHYLARQANRLYLMRGIEVPGGGAFHPKTYLFARRDEATLVVGSGNLTRQGIDAGKEVFTVFDTRTEQGLSTLRAWAAWIGRLVAGADDEQLTRRFAALREQCPWLVGMIGATPFAVNEERSLLDQFAEQLPSTVDELHVSAPYYDRNALALAEALDRIQPKELHLYFGLGTKVHGPSLAAVLETANCQLQVRRFDPATFPRQAPRGRLRQRGPATVRLAESVARSADAHLCRRSPRQLRGSAHPARQR
jgi:hypothetical protein